MHLCIYASMHASGAPGAWRRRSPRCSARPRPPPRARPRRTRPARTDRPRRAVSAVLVSARAGRRPRGRPRGLHVGAGRGSMWGPGFMWGSCLGRRGRHSLLEVVHLARVRLRGPGAGRRARVSRCARRGVRVGPASGLLRGFRARLGTAPWRGSRTPSAPRGTRAPPSGGRDPTRTAPGAPRGARFTAWKRGPGARVSPRRLYLVGVQPQRQLAVRGLDRPLRAPRGVSARRPRRPPPRAHAARAGRRWSRRHLVRLLVQSQHLRFYTSYF